MRLESLAGQVAHLRLQLHATVTTAKFCYFCMRLK